MFFCSDFDQALATAGPAAVFLEDPEGAWRFDPSWTRDCWGRAPGPHALEWAWLLLRDRGSGFVVCALVTSPTLLTEHPRLDVRAYPSREAAFAARSLLGHPPVSAKPW